jgi:hypothetical protein
VQKSKLNYKIKKKIEIFERVELPLLMRSGFELGSVSLSVENDEDCHSFDPGSKFGLEKKKPNGHPGPGAYLLFPITKWKCLHDSVLNFLAQDLIPAQALN